MLLLRSLLYAAMFYLATVLYVIAGLLASLVGSRPTRAVVRGWGHMYHLLAKHLLGITVRFDGELPREPCLIAIKHQSMLETLEALRLPGGPVVVIKRELADLPMFGFLTKRYGIIAVERTAGAKAVRALVSEGKKALATGRSIVIFPEGTRVPVGEMPPLGSGFAGLYRALGLPVVPIAMDSGRLWGRGVIHRSGVVTFKIGETIPAGLKRDEIEARVHAAINLFESGPQTGA
jgi:1-acyl-sn-glycerol-3-phosphate acyltransferase